MDKLDSKIEPMSQETADALIDAFVEFNNNIESMGDFANKFNKVICQEMARQTVDKFLGYVEKYTCATFFTRWYWKRKAFKMAKAVKELSNLLNEEL